MSERQAVSVESIVQWWDRTDYVAAALQTRVIYGGSTSLESMISILAPGEPMPDISEEALGEWVSEKSGAMVDRIKSLFTGIKEKLDGLMEKVGLKEKELNDNPYETYELSASPDTVNAGITTGRVALTVAAILAGYFVIRTVGTTAKVHSRVRKMEKKAVADDAGRREEYNKELRGTEEDKELRKRSGPTGNMLASMSASYQAKKELALSRYTAKKAEFESRLARERHADHKNIEDYKDRAANRFRYYWSARQIKAALIGLKNLIDLCFAGLTKFIQQFAQAFKQRPTGLGRVGLFRWIGRVTRDLLKLLGTSLWGIIKTVVSIFTGSRPNKKGDNSEEDTAEEKGK